MRFRLHGTLFGEPKKNMHTSVDGFEQALRVEAQVIFVT